jgi:hypothetical protein
MAVLRDALRLGVFEPFAKWYLMRQLRLSKKRQNKEKNGNAKANGLSNGHAAHGEPVAVTKQEAMKMHRSVLRFAEQGWSVVYYTLQWFYGLVRLYFFPTDVAPFNILLVHSPQSSHKSHEPWRPLDKLSTHTSCWPTQILLFISKRLLYPPNAYSQCRGA